jgi:hypothetical protein
MQGFQRDKRTQSEVIGNGEKWVLFFFDLNTFGELNPESGALGREQHGNAQYLFTIVFSSVVARFWNASGARHRRWHEELQ